LKLFDVNIQNSSFTFLFRIGIANCILLQTSEKGKIFEVDLLKLMTFTKMRSRRISWSLILEEKNSPIELRFAKLHLYFSLSVTKTAQLDIGWILENDDLLLRLTTILYIGPIFWVFFLLVVDFFSSLIFSSLNCYMQNVFLIDQKFILKIHDFFSNLNCCNNPKRCQILGKLKILNIHYWKEQWKNTP